VELGLLADPGRIRPWDPDLEERHVAKVHELFQRTSPAAASPE
jgi:hypothetical protein